jgi:recombination protein RecA
MSAAVLKQQFESVLGGHLDWQSKPLPETARTGIAEIDSATGGLPRGCLTEIYGPASSGRTSLLISILAAATARQEVCALVDAKATDLLIQGGGFGVVAMDLGDTPPASARRISMTSWFRLRRAVEHTPTILVTVARQSNAKTCASLMLECARERSDWSGVPGSSRLFRGIRISSHSSKQGRAAGAFACQFWQ